MAESNGGEQSGAQQRADGESNSEWDRLWGVVSKDPSDFSSWEGLVRIAEAVEGGMSPQVAPEVLQKAQMVYDHFLAKFPLCFGYWKKYADLELAVEGGAAADAVYERGVQSIFNSVDLWTHYVTFKIEHTKDQEVIRATFERGALAVGLDFLSHSFWDKYLEFEESRGQHARVLAILERVIRIPLHQYARFFEKYTQLSVTRPVAEILTTEEYHRLESEIRAVPVKLAEGEAPRERTAEEFELELRQRIHALKSEIYMRTQAEVMKRWVYEGEIRRPYFHVKPLDEAQLGNWRKYLDFEEGEGDVSRIYSLYERCLVACAMYEEFWVRYVKYLIAAGDMERAVNALYRAVNIHLHATRIQIRLINAAVQESQGQINEARQTYQSLIDAVPTAAEPPARLAHLERRQGNVDAGLAALDAAIGRLAPKSNGVAAEERDGEASTGEAKGRLFLLVQKALYLWHASKKPAEARQVFVDSVKSLSQHKFFWLSWFNFEVNQSDSSAPEHVKACFEALRASTHLTSEDRRDFALRYLDFLTERANDPGSYVTFHASLNKDFPSDGGAGGDSRKRGVDDDDPLNPSKRARTAGASPAPQAAPAAGQWAGGYQGYWPQQ